MTKPILNFHDLAYAYCDRQVNTPHELLQTLNAQRIKYQPEGFLLLECHQLDSSYCGSLTIVPYGPNNSLKEIPAHPISPRGLASDMSVVIGVLPAERLLDVAPEPVERIAVIVSSSQHGIYVQGRDEEAYDRQLALETYCRKLADERDVPVTLYLKRESGRTTFHPRKSSRKSKKR